MSTNPKRATQIQILILKIMEKRRKKAKVVEEVEAVEGAEEVVGNIYFFLIRKCLALLLLFMGSVKLGFGRSKFIKRACKKTQKTNKRPFITRFRLLVSEEVKRINQRLKDVFLLNDYLRPTLFGILSTNYSWFWFHTYVPERFNYSSKSFINFFKFI